MRVSGNLTFFKFNVSANAYIEIDVSFVSSRLIFSSDVKPTNAATPSFVNVEGKTTSLTVPIDPVIAGALISSCASPTPNVV